MMLWHWFASPLFDGPHWTLLTLVFTDDSVTLIHLAFFSDHCLLWLRRQKTQQRISSGNLAVSCCFCTDSGVLAEPWSFFWIEMPLLICEWCLQVDWAPAAESCDLNCCYPDNKDGNCPKELLLNRPTPSFALLTLSLYYLWWVAGSKKEVRVSKNLY